MHDILKNQTFGTDHVLVAVSAKEEGKIYELIDGTLTELEHVTEHPPGYSDNEGFFQRSGNGVTMGSGSVREEDDEHNVKAYLISFAATISKHISNTSPRAVLLVEPEYLSGQLVNYVTDPNHTPISTIATGNFVSHPKSEVSAMVERWYESDTDPADPDSVAGEENADEKRKILETAQMRNGTS